MGARHHQHNTPHEKLLDDSVTVTLPVHPFKGMRLRVVRAVYSRGSQRYIDAEHPRGWTIRLPVEWTDRSKSWILPLLDGHSVKLHAGGLLNLAKAVEYLLLKFASPHPSMIGQKEPIQGENRAQSSQRKTGSAGMAGIVALDAERYAGHVGRSRAQSTSRGGKERKGGKR